MGMFDYINLIIYENVTLRSDFFLNLINCRLGITFFVDCGIEVMKYVRNHRTMASFLISCISNYLKCRIYQKV